INFFFFFFFLMIRRPPRSTRVRSSAASDVYKRQELGQFGAADGIVQHGSRSRDAFVDPYLSLIHISEPTRLLSISYAVFCFNNTATSKIYTRKIVGSVRCV